MTWMFFIALTCKLSRPALGGLKRTTRVAPGRLERDVSRGRLPENARPPSGETSAQRQPARTAKPAAVKGSYLRKLAVSSTMGVGIKVDPASAVQA